MAAYQDTLFPMEDKPKSKRGGWHGPIKYRERCCSGCQTTFQPTNSTQKYCTRKCRNHWEYYNNPNLPGGWHDRHSFKEKPCVVCRTMFKPRSGIHKFCSDECKGKWKYIVGTVTTDSQYKEISGNWRRYFARLLISGGQKRSSLSVDDLLSLHERQGGLCALTGETLTCQLEKGTDFVKNASVDRLEAGGPYTVGNIQLVCKAVNGFRKNLPVSAYIEWCRKVVNYAGKTT